MTVISTLHDKLSLIDVKFLIEIHTADESET